MIRTPRHSLKILGSATDKKNKIAKLYVTQQKSVPLPCFCDSQGDPQHLRVFLSQPEGRQSMLNTKALDKYEDLGDNKFRYAGNPSPENFALIDFDGVGCNLMDH